MKFSVTLSILSALDVRLKELTAEREALQARTEAIRQKLEQARKASRTDSGR